MGFYEQRVTVVEPAKVGGDYGGGSWTWDPALGATEHPIRFGVEVQPRTTAETLEDGTRVRTVIGMRLQTPPGKDLVLPARAAIRYLGKNYDVVGEVARWPSSDYPSGVDHVEMDLERKEG